MFSTSRVAGLSEDFEVQANESYKGAAGAYRAMTEGYQNSYAVFESCIGLDFMEAAVVNESTSADEFAVIQEGFAGDFFTKIKEFLKKLIEKIKGIVNSFIAKVTGTFCRDGKKFVDKYRSEINKKDLSKMKFKWMKPKASKLELSTTDLRSVYGDAIDGCTKEALSAKDALDGTKVQDAYKSNRERLDDYSVMELCIEKTVGTKCTLSEFAKEYHAALWEDEETYEGPSEAGIDINADILNVLSDGSKATDKIKKDQKNSEDEVKKLITDVEAAQKKLNSLKADNEKQGANFREINNRLAIAMTAAQQISSLTTKYFACQLDEKKKELARIKRVATQAASYRAKKSANEDTDLLAEALGESAEYEVIDLFDNFVID